MKGLLKAFAYWLHEKKKEDARKGTPPRYIIRYAVDLADIPESRFAAFIEELPVMASHVRNIKAMNPRNPVSHDSPLIWIDDGKRNERVSANGVTIHSKETA